MDDDDVPQFVIVLDTQAVEQHVFQFDIGTIQELRNEAARLGVQLAMTDIQQHEIQAHITEQARQIKSIAKALKAGAGKRTIRGNADTSKDGGIPLPDLLKHHAVKTALAELDRAAESVVKTWDDLVASQTVRVIDSGHILASRVVPKYFASLPPFGAGRKKNEFPDALSIEAIRDLSASLSGTQVVVVSSDPDWVSALEDDTSIVFRTSIAEALQHVRKLDTMNSLIAGLLVEQQTQLNELVEEHFPELDFALAGDWSGNVDDVEPTGSTVKGLTVISFRDRAAMIEFEVDIGFHAEASYPADDWSEWYPTYMKAAIDKHETMIGTALIVLDKELEEIETIEDVSFDDDAVQVSLDDAVEVHRKRSPWQE